VRDSVGLGGTRLRCAAKPKGKPHASRGGARLVPALLLGALAIAGLSVFPVASSPARADSGFVESKWRYEERAGVPRFWIESKRGASFAVWCQDRGRGPRAVIDIDIDAKPAPPDQLVRIVIDRSMIKLRADAHGFIRTNCLTCADQAVWLWDKMRFGRFMQVLFDDGRYAGFRLTGLRGISGTRVCTRP